MTSVSLTLIWLTSNGSSRKDLVANLADTYRQAEVLRYRLVHRGRYTKPFLLSPRTRIIVRICSNLDGFLTVFLKGLVTAAV